MGRLPGLQHHQRGVTRVRCYFTTHPLISVGLFPSILLFGLQSSINWQQFKTPVIFLGVDRRVYPRHTSKKVILICRFVPFSLLKLGWNTKVVHSKQLGRTAKMIFLKFSLLGEERKIWATQKVDQ